MALKLRLFTLFICIHLFSFAQEQIKTELYSKFLGEKQGIQIYLPLEYQNSTERHFPVMYVLDGQEYFYFPISYQNMLRFKDKSPAFIVVAINSDRKKRRQLYYQESDKFITFLQQELVPYIDTNYKTLKEKERIFFGWEMAGGLALDIFNQHSTLFSAYFIASPTHFSSKRLAILNNLLTKDLGRNTFFYITRANAKDDEFMEHRFVELKKMLQNKKPKNSVWKFGLLENDSHYSTPSKTIHNGLRMYFKNYDPIRFFSLQDYTDFGGMDAIISYYSNRAKRYQISNKIHRETKHFMLLQALKDDNYKLFDYFATTFSTHLKTQLSNDFWVNRFGEFYIKNHKLNKALNLYNNYIDRFSDSALLYNSIGNIYKTIKEIQKAKQAYKKAIKLAKDKSDSNLMKYQANLKAL